MRVRLDGPRAIRGVSSVPTLERPPGGFGEPGQVRYLPLPDQSASQPKQLPRAPSPGSLGAERRRLERDLHDGVQNELVAVIVKLATAQEDPRTPPALADMLSELEARVQGALDSVRGIARGLYPPLLTDFGLTRALRAHAARAAIQVSIAGTASRSTREAEEAVYFACSEAIQNATKHAGPTAKVRLWLRQHHRALTVRIADDGRGFDPARTLGGTGMRNIRERIEGLGGILEVASTPKRGTILTMALPWPPRTEPK